VGLTGAQNLDRLRARASELDMPTTPRRRSGTDTAFRSALSEVQAELVEIHRYLTNTGRRHAGEVDEEISRARIDLSLELASLLFSAGAPHPQWRWWAAQAAGALLETGAAQSASVWATIAHDDALVDRLPEAPEPGARPARVVWWLATRGGRARGDGDRAVASDGRDDSIDAAWAVLAGSIPAANHAATDRALRTITDFWLDEDEDWEQFHPHFYPDFEPELNAVAALACKSGWEPTDWPPDALRFLEPGLAPGLPA
jgi:hypothetical protein